MRHKIRAFHLKLAMTALSGTNPQLARLALPARLDASPHASRQRWLCWSLAGALHLALFLLTTQPAVTPLPQVLHASIRLIAPPAVEVTKPAVQAAAPRTAPAAAKAFAAPQNPARLPAPAATHTATTGETPSPATSSNTPAPAAAPAAMTEARFDAAYLQNPKPGYPLVSRRQGEEGTVQLRVRVSADGRPQEVALKTSSGFPRLDQAAQEAVKTWRFQPAMRGDEPVESWVAVPIRFSLTSPA